MTTIMSSPQCHLDVRTHAICCNCPREAPVFTFRDGALRIGRCLSQAGAPARAAAPPLRVSASAIAPPILQRAVLEDVHARAALEREDLLPLHLHDAELFPMAEHVLQLPLALVC